MNAVRHADARSVTVAIDGRDREVVVDAVDDGHGLPSPSPPGGGLIIARTVVRNELRGTLDPRDGRVRNGRAHRCARGARGTNGSGPLRAGR